MKTLNKHQKRGISTTLAMLDEMLCEFEQMMEGVQCCGVMFSQKCKMNKNSTYMIKREIKEIRKRVSLLKDELGLKEKHGNVAKKIWSFSLGFCPSMFELQSNHFKGFGEPPPWYHERVDLVIEEIVLILRKIASIASNDMENE